MSNVSIWVELGGQPASNIGPYSPPTWETWADGGNGPASFSFGSAAKFANNATRPGTLMRIMCGSAYLWIGRVEDFDRNEGTVIGRGIQTDGDNIPALTGAGETTRDTTVALNTAAADPWKWIVNREEYAGGTATGDDDSPMMCGALLDLVAEQQGKRWGQDNEARIYMAADPTTPKWIIAPEAAAFGQTSEGQASRLVGRFFNGSTYQTTIRTSPFERTVRAEIVDLTERGTLTLAQANGILDAALSQTLPRSGWVNPVTLQRDQITTMGGTPAFLPAVHARTTMVRAFGVPTAFGDTPSTTLDVVLGKTRYTAGEDVIYLEPVDTAPRNLADVIAAS